MHFPPLLFVTGYRCSFPVHRDERCRDREVIVGYEFIHSLQCRSDSFDICWMLLYICFMTLIQKSFVWEFFFLLLVVSERFPEMHYTVNFDKTKICTNTNWLTCLKWSQALVKWLTTCAMSCCACFVHLI